MSIKENVAQKGLISPRLPHLFYGCDYSPEQWPEEIWLEDVKLMQEAGVNLVSLGIFAWARLEPQPGHYDFEWLDRIIDLLYSHGVFIDLATATASPPPWLAKLHPESLPVTHEGVTLWPGARQHYCPSSPAYRQGATALVEKIAKRYANHPALVLWHIGNEYGCHVAECYCDASAHAFREWLQNRYDTIEALNMAWGTAFWSQHYADWDEINPPRSAPTFVNPTQQLDFKRFSSDAVLECFELERTVLKKVTPAIPVTTNFMNFFKPLDYWKWAALEDIVSNDAYPDPSDPNSPSFTAMSYDLVRSLKKDTPWVLMEQTTSQVNWRPQNVLKRPGQMRLWSYQALARGANGIMFFQWRAARAGSEKFHGALVPHVGTENSRVWREVKQLGAELRQLDEVQLARVKAEVAILFDWESWWALELASKPSRDVKMLEQLQGYYRPLWQQNIAVDFVSPASDLRGYKVLLVPNLYMVREGDNLPAKLEKFVADGGTVVMSFFSGIANEDDHIYLGGYPAPFRQLLGIRVEEFDPYIPGQTNELRLADDDLVFKCELWSDVVDLEGAEALATFGQDFYAGRAAITRNNFGKGYSYYLGTKPEAVYMERLLKMVCADAGVQPTLNVPAGVEVVRRQNEEGSFLFVLNQTNQKLGFDLKIKAHDLLTGQECAGSLELEPYGVAVLATTYE